MSQYNPQFAFTVYSLDKSSLYLNSSIGIHPTLSSTFLISSSNLITGSNEVNINCLHLFTGNSGRLSLMDPRPGAQQCMPPRKKEKLPRELWRETYYEPVPGRLIMFPSWLWHQVETNQSNDIRISVSFNFIML